ncbi:MAG: hypothetical protein L3K23_10845 [Thermoplasmata archaeon]|nr:hypothetical protein [Thermoplasmata archaeon]
MARRKRAFFQRTRRRVARVRSMGRRVSRKLSFARRVGRGATRGLPSWAKPSRIAAYTGIAVGVTTLVFTPIPNGSGGNDSWLQRVKDGYSVYAESKNPLDLLGWDSVGNNAISIATLQLKQNAVSAVAEIVGFGIGASILAYFGM